MGIGYHPHEIGRGGLYGAGWGTTTALEYHFQGEIYAPKVSLWANIWAAFLGLNAQISGICYIGKTQKYFATRPEIGLGFYRVWLNYGYNFFL